MTAPGRSACRPRWLNFIDLLHVLAYPFLLWAAWLLHHRNARDAVSSILSLAVLLTIAAEQPVVDVPRIDPRSALAQRRDLRPRQRAAADRHPAVPARQLFRGAGSLLIALLPISDVPARDALPDVLRLLHDHRRPVAAADLRLTEVSRAAAADPLGAARDHRLRGPALRLDRRRLSEMVDAQFRPAAAGRDGAGISFALAVLVLQVGLLIALVRYRLYDAEFVISRSANVALITLGVAAVFAGTADGLKQIIYNYYGNTSSEGPIIFAAALSTCSSTRSRSASSAGPNSASRRTSSCCATILPEVARDMRETASLGEMLDEILARVDRGVRAVRSSAIVNGCVLRARGFADRRG